MKKIKTITTRRSKFEINNSIGKRLKIERGSIVLIRDNKFSIIWAEVLLSGGKVFSYFINNLSKNKYGIAILVKNDVDVFSLYCGDKVIGKIN